MRRRWSARSQAGPLGGRQSPLELHDLVRERKQPHLKRGVGRVGPTGVPRS